jgi:hypothetical protein
VRLAAIAVMLVAGTFVFGGAVAWAHGDPASDYLVAHDVFLPVDNKVDESVSRRLSDTVRAAADAGLPVKVAIIASRFDLGTAFRLYERPQAYADGLALELASHGYRDGLLVVMPNGLGYSGVQVVKDVSAPGADVTKEAEAATIAVRLLAAASGHPIRSEHSAVSQTRDRLTIAAGVTALLAFAAGVVLFRRSRTL